MWEVIWISLKLEGGILVSPCFFPDLRCYCSSYSCTEGSEWKPYTFSDLDLQVDGVLNEPGITTLIVRWEKIISGMAWTKSCLFHLSWEATSHLTHWGRVTHVCVSKLTIIGSDNGLSPGRHQAIIWTNTGMLLIGPLGTNFSEILSEIQTFSLKKICFKMSSAKCCTFRVGLKCVNSTLIATWSF